MNELGSLEEFEAEARVHKSDVVPDVPHMLFDLIGGSVSGCISIVVGQPFDTIKVRIQTQGSAFTSAIDCFRKTIAHEGIPALFKGMVPPLMTATAVNALVFASFGYTLRAMTQNQEEDPTYGQIFLAGSVAGLGQCVVLCPTELIKCRLQAQTGHSLYKGTIDCIRYTIKRNGVLGLYQGWWATVYREVPAFGLYFASYEYMKTSLLEQSCSPWSCSAIAGGLSGMLTWACVYPIDIAKSTIQINTQSTTWKDRSTWYVINSIRKQHGWRYLFRGIGPTLLRALPVNGVIFPVYEGCVKFLNTMHSRYNAQ